MKLEDFWSCERRRIEETEIDDVAFECSSDEEMHDTR